MRALVFRRVVLRLLRREQRAGAGVEQPDRVEGGHAHPDRQGPACRPVTVVVHGQRGVAVVCAHLEEASRIRAVAAICAVLLVVLVFDPAKYQWGWEVSLGGVLTVGPAESLKLPSSVVSAFVRPTSALHLPLAWWGGRSERVALEEIRMRRQRRLA